MRWSLCMSQLSCSDTTHTHTLSPAHPQPDWPLGPPGLQGTATTAPSPQGGLCPNLSQVQGLRGPAALGPDVLPPSASIWDFGGGLPFTPHLPTGCPPLASPDLPRCARDQRTGKLGEIDGEKPHFQAESLLSKRNHPTSNQASRNVTATDRVAASDRECSHLPVSTAGLPSAAASGHHSEVPLAPLSPSSAPTLAAAVGGPGSPAPVSWVSVPGPRGQPGYLEEEQEERMLPAPQPPRC